MRFREVDLYGLEGALRNAALDALVTGAPLPLLLHGTTVLSAGDFDVEAITRALESGA